jgi:hypothetical protein
MSMVTNIILSIGTAEDADMRLNEVNYFFKRQGKEGDWVEGLVSIEDDVLPRGWYGGNKSIEANIYIGAYKNIDVAEFLKYIRECVKWETGENQLFIKEDFETKFHTININSDNNEIEVALSTIKKFMEEQYGLIKSIEKLSSPGDFLAAFLTTYIKTCLRYSFEYEKHGATLSERIIVKKT